MLIFEEKKQNQEEYDFEKVKLNEMATACHPKDSGGKYPMWIRVEYTNGEHNPPHAHLYSAEKRPSPQSLITKFLITKNAPKTVHDIKVMKGKPEMPGKYAKLILIWAKSRDENGLNNWVALKAHWLGLENTFL